MFRSYNKLLINFIFEIVSENVVSSERAPNIKTYFRCSGIEKSFKLKSFSPTSDCSDRGDWEGKNPIYRSQVWP